MKTYHVKMNDTIPTDNRKPLGIYYRHLASINLSTVKQDAEKLFFGQCETIIEKALASSQLRVKDMVDGTSYEILADYSFTNDTIIFRKQGNIIYSTIRGGEFPEEGFTKWYDLSIIRLLENTKDIPQLYLTLEELEWVDFEVYNEVSMLEETPGMFADIYGEG